MLGIQCVKADGRAQDIVALSSGEAEFYNIVKGGSRGFGVVGISRDLGFEISLQIETYSSAVKIVFVRRGAGKSDT